MLPLDHRGQLPHELIHVMNLERTATGINKAEDDRGWMPESGSSIRCGGSS